LQRASLTPETLRHLKLPNPRADRARVVKRLRKFLRQARWVLHEVEGWLLQRLPLLPTVRRARKRLRLLTKLLEALALSVTFLVKALTLVSRTLALWARTLSRRRPFPTTLTKRVNLRRTKQEPQ
jgi:hypothetical protein